MRVPDLRAKCVCNFFSTSMPSLPVAASLPWDPPMAMDLPVKVAKGLNI